MDSTTIFIAILVAIGSVVPFVWKYLLAKSQTLRDWLDKSQLDEIAIGAATETWESMVRDMKSKADDGKLTSAEKKEAMKTALGTFKDLAKDQGVKAAKDLAEPLIKGLIEKAINRLKGDANVVRIEKPPTLNG